MSYNDFVGKITKHIVGIDEVGRGPLAGPVAVCALCICQNKILNQKTKFAMANFKSFKDSKKLSHSQRLEWLEKINFERDKGNIIYKVCFQSNKVIDTKGLVYAINKALASSLEDIKINGILPTDCQVLLDGGLHAPKEYKNQETIIKGDEKKLAIALASIVAKVTRDEMMVKFDRKYPQYGFAQHKGYGTKNHYQAILKKGISPLHRRSFLKGLLNT